MLLKNNTNDTHFTHSVSTCFCRTNAENQIRIIRKSNKLDLYYVMKNLSRNSETLYLNLLDLLLT